MLVTDLLVAMVIVVGLVGIVVPVLPGSVLILGSVLVWAVVAGSPTGWVVLGVAATLLAVGAIVKFVVPGRRLKASGIPRGPLALGLVLGVIGFFVVPVVGLFLGFVLGVYLAELQRVGRDAAWPSTVGAVKAVGLSILIELAAGLLASCVWLVGAVVV